MKRGARALVSAAVGLAVLCGGPRSAAGVQQRSAQMRNAFAAGQSGVSAAATTTPTPVPPTPRNVFFNPSQSSIANVGGTAAVAVSIDDSSQLNAFDFTVQYDSTIVRATAADGQSPFTGCPFAVVCNTPAPTPPVGRVICSFACPTPIAAAPPINLVNITFQGQATGNSPLQVSNCELAIVSGISATPVPCTPGSGNIVVASTPPTPTPTGVVLAVVPTQTVVALGSQFSVALQVQAGGQLVDGATASLDFNPAVLQVVSISPGSALPVPPWRRGSTI